MLRKGLLFFLVFINILRVPPFPVLVFLTFRVFLTHTILTNNSRLFYDRCCGGGSGFLLLYRLTG